MWQWDRMSGWHCPQAGLHKPWGAGKLTYLGPFIKIEGEEVPTRQSLSAQVKELEAQLAIARQALAESRPTLPKNNGDVIKFTKFNYAWAAIKANGLWYVTQDGSRTARQGVKPMTDDQLLEWLFERNWDSVEAMF